MTATEKYEKEVEELESKVSEEESLRKKVEKILL